MLSPTVLLVSIPRSYSDLLSGKQGAYLTYTESIIQSIKYTAVGTPKQRNFVRCSLPPHPPVPYPFRSYRVVTNR